MTSSVSARSPRLAQSDTKRAQSDFQPPQPNRRAVYNRPPDRNAAHYTIEPAGRAWSVTVYRKGIVDQVVTANSHPEAFRLSRAFADAGLVGYVLG